MVPESDHLTLLNVYQLWQKANYSALWCSDHYLHVKGMKKAKEVREQLVDIMKTQKIPISSCDNSWDVVRKAICSAYFYNSAKLKGIGEYVNMLTGMPTFLHPSSSLFGLGFTPDYLCYHELVMTNKEYMMCVTAVEPEWLTEMGPMFFSMKQSIADSKISRSKAVQESLLMSSSQSLPGDNSAVADEKLKRFKPEKVSSQVVPQAGSLASKIAAAKQAAAASGKFGPSRSSLIGGSTSRMK
jgi:pre-mRNA-splicing factor ATP-dependent RNA helicase DHX38/PRP16